MELIYTSEFFKKLKLHRASSHSENFFQSFRTKFLSLLYMISLAYKISHCLSTNHSRITTCNLHWCYTFCTGVTLFALVLHLNGTALNQSELSNFFHVHYALLLQMNSMLLRKHRLPFLPSTEAVKELFSPKNKYGSIFEQTFTRGKIKTINSRFISIIPRSA